MRKAAIVVLLAACAYPREAASSHPFHFRGTPVHPGAVRLLQGRSADPAAVVLAVDLAAYHRSNAYIREAYHRDGFWGVRIPGSDEHFEYRHIGATPSGTHVVMTLEYGGGSGIFKHLLFLRIEPRSVHKDGERRTCVVLHAIGSFTLGDRDDGEVFLQDRLLVIGKSRYRSEDQNLLLD